MGTNEKRERKLRQHEKPIWRKAFEESMKHTSIESATRNAWKAVDEWNGAGAFNESNQQQESANHIEDERSYRKGFGVLLTNLGRMRPTDSLGPIQCATLSDSAEAFYEGHIDLHIFKEEVDSLFSDLCE